MIKIKFDKPLNENQIELLVKVAERYNCAVGGSDADVTITSAGDDATFNVSTVLLALAILAHLNTTMPPFDFAQETLR